MSSITLSVFVLLICLILVNSDHHIKKVEKEEMEADKDVSNNLVLLYGSVANLTCSDHHFKPEGHKGARYQWVLPAGEILTPYEVDTSDGHFELQRNGSQLVISGIERSDFGIYYCLVMLESDFTIHTAIKWGININGPYFGDLSAKYEPRLKNGLLAGIVVFLVMSMFCFNYDSFQARHDKGGRPVKVDLEISMTPYLQTGKTRSDMEMSHTNNAFANDHVTSNVHETAIVGDGQNPHTEEGTEPRTEF